MSVHVTIVRHLFLGYSGTFNWNELKYPLIYRPFYVNTIAAQPVYTFAVIPLTKLLFTSLKLILLKICVHALGKNLKWFH